MKIDNNEIIFNAFLVLDLNRKHLSIVLN